MTRQLRRMHDYELTLEIKNEQFIAPPRQAQRNWLLNQTMAEFAFDLDALHEQAGRFVPGAISAVQIDDRTHTVLSDEEIMEDWQIELMRAMAEEVTSSRIIKLNVPQDIRDTWWIDQIAVVRAVK
jgi:guanidinoacetate N-methyltransferase